MYKTKVTGFSLLELIIVISVLGIIMALALPNFRLLRPNIILNSTTRQIASDLRYAQQLAVTEQIIYSAIFNQTNNSYQIVKSNPQTIIKTVELKPPVTIQAINNLTNNTVSFNAAGAASESGEVILINTNGRTNTIEIKPSGYVKIQN